MEDFQNIKFVKTGGGEPIVFWGHGWGQSHKVLLPLTQSLEKMATHYVLDFPGFGESPAPDDVWGTEDYADACAALIRAQTSEKVFWVGHSFGCRVGLQLAARHPDLVAGMCLVAGAGLPRRRPLLQKLYFKARIAVYKFLKNLIPFGFPEDWLKKKFGSADYNSAGAMKSIFVRVVNEDLSRIAEDIKCKVTLIYGVNDSETPPEIGERLHTFIPHSSLFVLEGFDHYSILSDGKHKVIQKLNQMIKEEVS